MPRRTGYWYPRRDPQRTLTTAEARRRLIALAPNPAARRKL
jgi:hypothetical protein